MLIMSFFVSFVIFLLLLLSFVSYIISESGVSISREELSSYECGFEHHSLSRLPLSLRYFILTLVFLIFDIEIILLSYYPLFNYFPIGSFSNLIYIFFVVILFLGLLYEWLDGSLDWVM